MNLQESPFFKQANLMIECLPAVFEEKCFALKGGTAINLFFRELPRLSVDIDLVYLPVEDYDQSMQKISQALDRIAKNLELRIPKSKALLTHAKETKLSQKINLQFAKMSVVIEPNLVIRGCLDDVIFCSLSKKSQDLFQKDVNIPLLSEDEVYAGKFCAGLERQHPRDLFDIKVFLEEKGLNLKLKKMLIVYLLCSSRPIHEILFPTLKDISLGYEKEFRLMTAQQVPLNELLKTRMALIKKIKESLDQKDMKFITSFCEGSPQWELLGLERAKTFPGIQWKQKNLDLLKTQNPQKHAGQLKELIDKFKSL